jgi:hypothetical protein
MLRGFFDSKKAAVLVAGIVIFLGARFGLDIPREDAVVGQGIADHGKEAAKLKGGAS